MTPGDAERVKSLIASILEPRLVVQGSRTITLTDDLDLRDEGIIDSFGFVQLIIELEARLGLGIDLSDLDTEDLTKVGALARHIAAFSSRAAGL